VVAPFGYPAKGDWNVIHNFAPWIWGAGGSFLDSTATHSNLANPKTIEGITFYLNLTRDNYNNKSNLDKNTSQISADFDNGQFAFITETVNKAMYLDGPQNLMRSDASIVGRNYACIPLPSSPTPGKATYFVGGSNLGVFHSSKHKREAQALLRYLAARPSAQYQFSRMSGFLPGFNETYNSRYFTENANRRVFREMVQKGRGYPAVPYWAGIETGILAKGFDNIFSLIADAKGEWPEKEIQAEILKMDQETERFIQSELRKK
jgi:multiple sugar transport system substrate-binding protein